MTKKIACLVVLALSAAAASVVAQETKIQLKDLPQAVQKAAQQEQANGATLKGFAKDVEGGKTFYEVETAVKGHTRDLLYDASGQLVEVEEEIASSAVPPAAMKALASNGTVTKVEMVTKGKTVAYEAVVKTKSGKSMEVAVDAQGNTVKL
jgi:uncharacterized membrane protein YkoI